MGRARNNLWSFAALAMLVQTATAEAGESTITIKSHVAESPAASAEGQQVSYRVPVWRGVPQPLETSGPALNIEDVSDSRSLVIENDQTSRRNPHVLTKLQLVAQENPFSDDPEDDGTRMPEPPGGARRAAPPRRAMPSTDDGSPSDGGMPSDDRPGPPPTSCDRGHCGADHRSMRSHDLWDNHGGDCGGCSSDCCMDGCGAGCGGRCGRGLGLGCGTDCGCSDCGCDDCGGGDCLDDCGCDEFWAHRSGGFGEYLLLQPHDVDMPYAYQQIGTTATGHVGEADPEFEQGFRVGFIHALSDCSSVTASYTQFNSHTEDSLAAPPVQGGSVASLILPPGTIPGGLSSQLIDTSYDIDFQYADFVLNRLLTGTDCRALNGVVGVRYANLEQQFSHFGDFDPSAGPVHTSSDIDFDGVGLRLGLDGKRRFGCTGMEFYSNGFVNVMFGEFTSSFQHVNATNGVVQASSVWEDNRVVPILEYELGLAWTSTDGRLRLSSGYYTAFWFNVITTPEYAQAVQTNDFVDIGDSVTFHGFTSRVELRF